MSFLASPATVLNPLPTTNARLNSGGATSRHHPSLLILSSSSYRDIWTNTRKSLRHDYHRRDRHHRHRYIDRSIDMDDLLLSLSCTTTPQELHAVMSPYLSSGSTTTADDHHNHLSLRFMLTLLSREPDWRRTLALLDWMHGPGGYPPTVPAYNVTIRNTLRARQWPLAAGLVLEMRDSHALSPDPVTYSTLLSSLGRAGLLDQSLLWLRRFLSEPIPPDLPLLTTLLHLLRHLPDPSQAASLASHLLRHSHSLPLDLLAYNAVAHALARSGLLRQARDLLPTMRAAGVPPDTVTYTTILAAFVSRQRYLEALSLFGEMRERRVPLDVTAANIMIDAYGQLDMPRDADRLFWSLRQLGVSPSVVTYNTMLRVYGDAELVGEAVHLFRLMQSKEIEQNAITYNTMIKIYGKSLEHEKAGNLVQEMQRRGIKPNAFTYSTIISIWARAGKLDRSTMLFQKLRSSGIEIDPVLYQTMIVAYERAGLVGHAKRLLHDLKQPAGIPRSTAVTILANAGQVEEATWVFRLAVDAGEVNDIEVFRCMMDLYVRNRKHGNVIEVFEKMRAAGQFPDPDIIATVLNAYGKLQEFDKADAVYKEMQEEECLFTDRVHFQMLSLLGARRDFEGVELLLRKLNADPDIDKKELHLVAAGVYERANKLDEASRIISRISKKTPVAAAVAGPLDLPSS